MSNKLWVIGNYFWMLFLSDYLFFLGRCFRSRKKAASVLLLKSKELMTSCQGSLKPRNYYGCGVYTEPKLAEAQAHLKGDTICCLLGFLLDFCKMTTMFPSISSKHWLCEAVCMASQQSPIYCTGLLWRSSHAGIHALHMCQTLLCSVASQLVTQHGTSTKFD